MPKITKPCSVCGQPVTRWPSLFYGEVFCSKACKRQRYAVRFAGQNNPDWQGGRYIEPEKGYVMVRCPSDFAPMARQNGYVLEHRLIMAQSLGRCLEPAEVVHHLNGDLQDNRLENLRLYADHRAHYVGNHAQAIADENHRTGRTASYHLRRQP